MTRSGEWAAVVTTPACQGHDRRRHRSRPSEPQVATPYADRGLRGDKGRDLIEAGSRPRSGMVVT
jgi:hypothetical protein